MENYKAVIRSKESGSAKFLLNKGMVPGVVYGKSSKTLSIAFESKVLNKLMLAGGFYSKIINVDLDGKSEKVLPKALQYHPVTDKLIHFDFLRVQDDTKVTVEVHVEYLNQEVCPGLKQGGVLNLVRRSVELSCNANNIPEKLQYDLIESEIGDSIKISNIELPEGVKPTITDRDFVVSTLVPPTIEVEEEKPEEEGIEGEEGVEGVEGTEGVEGAEGEGKEEKSQDKDKKEEPAEKKSK
jgi:large subunit ribosomal protein L25